MRREKKGNPNETSMLDGPRWGKNVAQVRRLWLTGGDPKEKKKNICIFSWTTQGKCRGGFLVFPQGRGSKKDQLEQRQPSQEGTCTWTRVRPAEP